MTMYVSHMDWLRVYLPQGDWPIPCPGLPLPGCVVAPADVAMWCAILRLVVYRLGKDLEGIKIDLPTDPPPPPFHPHQKNLLQGTNEIYQRGWKSEADFRCTNCFRGQTHPPEAPPPPLTSLTSSGLSGSNSSNTACQEPTHMRMKNRTKPGKKHVPHPCKWANKSGDNDAGNPCRQSSGHRGPIFGMLPLVHQPHSHILEGAVPEAFPLRFRTERHLCHHDFVICLPLTHRVILLWC